VEEKGRGIGKREKGEGERGGWMARMGERSTTGEMEHRGAGEADGKRVGRKIPRPIFNFIE
jgi:hypothetical protein